MKHLVIALVLSAASASSFSMHHTSTITESLTSCLSQNIKYERDTTGLVKSVKVAPTVTPIDGTTRVEMDLKCTGESAKSLYENIGFYGIFTETVVFSDSSVHEMRKMSPKNNSKCFRKVKTKYGTEANEYRCYIVIDLYNEILSNLGSSY